MADSTTTNVSLTKPEVGASADSWGTKINTNFDTLDNLFTSGPALLVTKGGTGATTASAARTNLGLGTVAIESTVPVSKGGTGATTITSGSLIKGNGTSAFSAASAADIVAAIGSTAVTNATNATTATTASSANAAPTAISNSGSLSGNLAGSTRAFDTTYTNSSGRPLVVYVGLGNTNNSWSEVYLNGALVMYINHYGTNSGACFIVPNSFTYQVYNYGVGGLSYWYEFS